MIIVIDGCLFIYQLKITYFYDFCYFWLRLPDDLTGGNADGSGRTEADVMHDILLERGVAEDRMILEDQANSTKENFRNTAKMIDPREPVVLISSDYHMDRAVRTAESAGFSDVLRLPAPSSFRNYGANILSEVILELNELTLRKQVRRSDAGLPG